MQIISSTPLPQFEPGTYAPFLDITGLSVNNLVFDEVQVFETNGDSPHTFIMPLFAPFFASSLVVKIKDEFDVYVTKTLGADYFLAFPFLGASRALGVPIFAGIKFSGIVAQTDVKIDYQTLGGQWITGDVVNAAIMLEFVANPCAVAFEQVNGQSIPFPIISSAWDKTDPTNMANVISVIDEITKKTAERELAVDCNYAISHLINNDNPHLVTKAQVNLGLVSNLQAASNITAQDIENNDQYINTAQANAMMTVGISMASATARGAARLNLGTVQGDDADDTKALTATGFTTITSNPESAINRAYNKGQLSRVVSPFPFTYPVTWRGNSYANQQAFVSAVETYVGVSPLEYNSNNGTFWFPANTTLPDLSV